MANQPSLKISVIIPVFNEEKKLGSLLRYLQQEADRVNLQEIIVVDGGSHDRTLQIASEFDVVLLHSGKGRARQMNYGARYASGDILYFLHADTLPPKKFGTHIVEAVKSNTQAGCFRMQFESASPFLKFFAWFTRLNYLLCRGGDQSLFITTRIFRDAKGFNEAYTIYEDVEFIGRLYKITAFQVLPWRVRTSARRYKKTGMVKLQYHFGMIHLKNFMGEGPDQLYDYYKRNIST